jgi:two-component system OmpR family sensor kinase
MTLRLRLVVGLVVLTLVGLGAFGVVTYELYSHSEWDRLDDQIEQSTFAVAGELADEGGIPGGQPGGPQGQSGGDGPSTTTSDPGRTGGGPAGGEGPPPLPGLQVYGELLAADGDVLDTTTLGDLDDEPDLPGDLPPDGRRRYLTTGSVDGDTEWRVLVTEVPDEGGGGPRIDPDAAYIVVAVPTHTVRASLDRLVLVEAVAALGLLGLLGLGAWLILRRGLRSLEQMAATAGTITAGELHTRVEPADDRSEVGQLEDAFRQQEATEQRLRQFLADASHELRTPLTSIQGFAELFRLGADRDEADLAVTLRRIEEDARRMRKLVDDLLLLARLDQTRPVEREPVDLAVLAAEACSDSVAVDPDRPVTLDAPHPVVVQGDRTHLRQAVDNLVTNAVRHTPAGTPIEVVARIDVGRAVVTVRDHGPGLDDEALAHVFDRFWQADSARSEAGAGLGLSIVAGIAAEHGGAVHAANADDDGAVFTLDLPISTPGPEAANRTEG